LFQEITRVDDDGVSKERTFFLAILQGDKDADPSGCRLVRVAWRSNSLPLIIGLLFSTLTQHWYIFFTGLAEVKKRVFWSEALYQFWKETIRSLTQ